MRLKVLFLALNFAILYDSTALTSNITQFFANRTNAKVGSDLIIRANFIGHISIQIANIRIGAQVNQEARQFLSASLSYKMERSVALLISNIWFRAIIQQHLENVTFTIMSCSFHEWRPQVQICLIDVSFSLDQPFTNCSVLLHACQCEGALTSDRLSSRICTKVEQHLHNF